MKVRLLTIMAGPDRLAGPNDVVDLPPAEAKGLVKGGYAEEVPDDTPLSGQPAPPAKGEAAPPAA